MAFPTRRLRHLSTAFVLLIAAFILVRVQSEVEEVVARSWLMSCSSTNSTKRAVCSVNRNIRLVYEPGTTIHQVTDLVFEGVTDSATLDLSQPVELIMAPDVLVTIRRLRINGVVLKEVNSVSDADFLNMQAFRFMAGSSGSQTTAASVVPPRLALQDATIVTPSCKTFALHQKYACDASPSLNFTVDPGLLHIMSYRTRYVSAYNVTLQCSDTQVRPPCTSRVVSTAQELVAGLRPCDYEALQAQDGCVGALSNFLYVNRSISLRDAWDREHLASTPPNGSVAAQDGPHPVAVFSQHLVIAGGTAASTSSAPPTVLDLAGSTSFIIVTENSAVELRNLTLVNPPLGPQDAKTALYLKLLQWTFQLPRKILTKRRTPSLTVRGVAIMLDRSELALWHMDLTQTVPLELSEDFCAMKNGVVKLKEYSPPPVTLTGGGLFVPDLVSSHGPGLTFKDIVLLPEAAVVKSKNCPQMQPVSMPVVQCQPALCQLSPAMAIRPTIIGDAEIVKGIDNLIKPFALMPVVFLNATVPDFVAVFQTNMALLWDEDTPNSFSYEQVKVSSMHLWLGLLRQQLLHLSYLSAAINIHADGCSLTVRQMILAGLAPARLQPSSPAWTASNMNSGLTVPLSTMASGSVISGSTPAAATAPALRASWRRTLEVGDSSSGPPTLRDGVIDSSSGPPRLRDGVTDTLRPSRRKYHRRDRSPGLAMTGHTTARRATLSRLLYNDNITGNDRQGRIAVEEPAGSHPTGGLPAALTNFTSCLWVFDFNREEVFRGEQQQRQPAGRRQRWLSEQSSPEASNGDFPHGTPLPHGQTETGVAPAAVAFRVFLDSVTLMVPYQELAVLTWAWAEHMGAATSHWELEPNAGPNAAEAAAAVQQQLQAMLLGSRLAAGVAPNDLARMVTGLLAGGGADVRATSGDAAELLDRALVFDTFSWCGLLGQNVTLTVQAPPVPGDVNASASPAYQGQLKLPVMLTQRNGSANAQVGVQPGSTQPGGISHQASGESSAKFILASTLGAACGLMLAVICLWIIAQHCKRHQACAPHTCEPHRTTAQPDKAGLSSACFRSDIGLAMLPSDCPITACESDAVDPPCGGTFRDCDTASASKVLSLLSTLQMPRHQPSPVVRAMASLYSEFSRAQERVARPNSHAGNIAPAAIANAASTSKAPRFTTGPTGPATYNIQVDGRGVCATAPVQAVGGQSSGPVELGSLAPPSPARPAAAAIAKAAANGGACGAVVQHEGSGTQLVLLAEIGRGAQGVVFRGRWKGLDVAVKSLVFQQAGSSHDTRAINAIREAAIASSVSHGNVVATYTHHILQEDYGFHTSCLQPTEPQPLASQPPLATHPLAAPQPPMLAGSDDHRNSASSSEHSPELRPNEKQAKGNGAVVATTASSSCTIILSRKSTSLTSKPHSAAVACANRVPSSAPSHELRVWRLTLVQELCDAGSLRQCLDAGLLSGSRWVSIPIRGSALSGRSSEEGCRSWQNTGARPPSGAPGPDSCGGPGLQHCSVHPCVMVLAALQVACGMGYLHSLGVLHGDLSSSNVLLKSVPAAVPEPPRCAPSMPNSGATLLECSKPPAATLHPDGQEKRATHTQQAPVYDDIIEPVDLGGTGDGPPDASRQQGSGWLLRSGVLQGYGYIAKVSDFGLSGRLLDGQTHLSGPCRRSLLYSAPELVNCGMVTKGTDVYAFAVLMYEIATGVSLPCILRDMTFGREIRDWLTSQRLPGPPATALPSMLLRWPEHVPAGYMEVAAACLSEDPCKRPPFNRICSSLWDLLASLLS